MLYLASMLVSFFGVFVRVFQQKNIQHGHKKLAFATSYVYALTDFLVIGFMVKGDWWVVLTSGSGAALGVVTAMTVHSKVVKR